LPADFSAGERRGLPRRLLQQSATNPGTFMISPASVYLALAMTLNGADGTTKEAMLAVLSDHSLSSRLDQSIGAQLADAAETAPRAARLVACLSNSIWFDQTFTASVRIPADKCGLLRRIGQKAVFPGSRNSRQ
jgi:hypothetical protein